MEAITITPDDPTFGCVRAGFIYTLRVRVTNVSPLPQRVKVMCQTVDGETNTFIFKYLPVMLASGIAQTLEIGFHALEPRTSKCNFIIMLENRSKITRMLTVYVMNDADYKILNDALRRRGEQSYRNGIEVVGRLPQAGSIMLEENESLFSTALIPEEEMEDLRMMPILENMFWDPTLKKVCIDRELCKVRVETSWKLDESIENTRIAREERLNQLETLGIITHKSLFGSQYVTDS